MRIGLLGAERIGKMRAQALGGIDAVDRTVDSGEMDTRYSIRTAGHDPAPQHEACIPVCGGRFRDFSGHDGPRQVTRSVGRGMPPAAGPARPDFHDHFADACREEMLGLSKLSAGELAAGEMATACTARERVESARIAEAATRARKERRIDRLQEIPA